MAFLETPTIHTSVVMWLEYHGIKSDYKSRVAFASLFGIKGYTGTAEQNVQLHSKLKSCVATLRDA